MKSNTRLDSIVFQLTPTRTRCDLVITANGKTEKVASGLLNPFLAHLKAAREQIEKGGYSIVLKPKQESDAAWFTKGTVERFVRFVSTPEILERVSTVESEILQIEKAISIQVNSETGVNSVEDLPTKSEESIKGGKIAPGNNDEKAIVLYQPVSHQQDDDGSTMQGKNSKVQLVQVLQTRKTALQKEQGMAFARAVAASFDIDNISALLSFAECFGASRMMDACKRFVELWKAKHENGQWVEIETTEAMPSMNASGIMFLSSNEQGDIGLEKIGMSSSCAIGGDVKPQADNPGQPNSQECIPGQFPHPVFPPWQMHPQVNGLPVFQPYPMQGMPYYQNYPGNSPYFRPPYSSLDDSRLHADQRIRQRRHSMDSKNLSTDPVTQEVDDSGRRMQHNVDIDEGDSMGHRSRKKGSKSSRKQSGTVVIRNFNYIASANQGSSDGDPESCSDSGTDDEEKNVNFDEIRKSKKKGVYSKFDKEQGLSGQVGEDGQWQAFQNFLLKDADESSNSARSIMFDTEREIQGRKRHTSFGDASVLGGHNLGENRDGGFRRCHEIAGDMTCIKKPTDDHMLNCDREPNLSHTACTDCQNDLQFTRGRGQRGTYRRGVETHLDCMINRPENLTDVWDSSLDPVVANGIQGSSNGNNGGSLHGHDESFMIQQRSGPLEQLARGGMTAMDMNYNHTVGTRNQSYYEPNDLNLMPDRMMEDGQNSYDPALDYEMQAQVKEAAVLCGKKKQVTTDGKERPRKEVKDQKLKAQKRITAGARREKPSKSSPSEDARARAERLRAFKADLQKLKKEKEEEQKKRLETLRLERQKRIAARSGVNPAQSPLQSQQGRKQLPKLSPVTPKGSKFSDAEPGSSSPLQRSTLKTISKVSSDSSRTSKAGRLNNGNFGSGNRLSRSASSLNVRKKENDGATPESKVTMVRIRRLSEPKSSAHHVSSEKVRNAEAASRKRASIGPELKKVYANANPDKTKSAVVPELKLQVSKGPSFSTQKKSTTTKMLQKQNDKILSNTPVSANRNSVNARSSTNMSRDDMKISFRSEGDENTIVEKTVVTLECEKPSLEFLQASEDRMNVQNMQSDAYKPGGISGDDVTTPPPASPIFVREVDREPYDGQVKGKFDSHLNEMGAVYAEKVLPDVANSGTTGKLYQAPYARVSSIEDPCMTKSDYGKSPPTGVEVEAASLETTVRLSDGQKQDLVQISKVGSGKHQGRESSKGFRRLLKFGKKNPSASESNIGADKASLDGSVGDYNVLNGSSSEVFTLKNLLTQEESSSAGTTPKKSSRSFSLLSPFRNKTSEKKLST